MCHFHKYLYILIHYLRILINKNMKKKNYIIYIYIKKKNIRVMMGYQKVFRKKIIFFCFV